MPSVDLAFDLYPANDPAGKISTSLQGARLVRLTVGDQLSDAEFWPSLYGPGKGFIEIHGDHADTQHIERRGWVAVYRIDDGPERPLGGFFLEEGDFTALSKEEQRGRVLRFQGEGGKRYFERFVLGDEIYAPGQVARGSYNVPHKWTWNSEPPGGILVRLIEEGKNAPELPYAAFTYDFSRSLDSNGDPWLEEGDYQVDTGARGSKVLDDQIKRGLIVEVDATLNVFAYRDISDFRTDRTSGTFAADKVRFEAGVNIGNDLPKRIASKRERTHVLMRGRTGGYHLIDTDTDGNPIGGEPFYDFIKSDTTANPTTLERMGQVYLTRLRTTSDQCKVRHLIGPGGVDGEQGYDPGPDGDYWLGDLVTVHTGAAEHDYDEQPIEVAAIRYCLDKGNWIAEVDLGAKYTDSRSAEGSVVTAISSIIQQIVTPIQFCQPDQLTSGQAEYGSHNMDDNGGAAFAVVAISVPDADSALAVFVEDPAGDNGPSSVVWRPTAGSAVGEQALTTRATALSDPGSGNIRSYSIDAPTPGNGSGGAGEVRVGGVSVESTVGVIRIDQTLGYQDDAATTVSGAGTTTVSPDTDPGGQIATAISSPTAASSTLDTGTERDHHVSAGFDPQGLEIGSQPADVADATTDVTWTYTGLSGRGIIAMSFLPADSAILFDGHPLLVGTDDSGAAKRCDDTEHWHEAGSGAPTVNDDVDAGFRPHTLWINDDGEAWFAASVAAGAADWIAIGGGGGAPDDATYLVTAAHADLSAEIVVGAAPGGELGGTWAVPTVDATHSGSTHDAATNTHIADATDAHDASAVSVLDTGGNFAGTDVEAVLAELDAAIGGGGHTEDHDHDGSPTQKLIQANSHETPDTDTAAGSLHHTIGAGATQAAAGDHAHGGGSDLVYSPIGSDLILNNVDQVVATWTLAGMAAGSTLLVDAWFTILNNSGATRIVTLKLDVSALFVIEFATGALAASATLAHPMRLNAVVDMRSTSLAYMVSRLEMQLLPGLASGADTTTAATLLAASGWGTTATDLSAGSKQLDFRVRSATATAGQTLRLHLFTVRKFN